MAQEGASVKPSDLRVARQQFRYGLNLESIREFFAECFERSARARPIREPGNVLQGNAIQTEGDHCRTAVRQKRHEQIGLWLGELSKTVHPEMFDERLA